MMQYVNATTSLELANTTSNCIVHSNISTLSIKSLLDIRAQYTTETTGMIMLNCSGLESINSHGICLFIKLLIYSLRQKKRLQAFGLSEHNQYIFEITRLSEFIDIVSTQPQVVMTVHTA